MLTVVSIACASTIDFIEFWTNYTCFELIWNCLSDPLPNFVYLSFCPFVFLPFSSRHHPDQKCLRGLKFQKSLFIKLVCPDSSCCFTDLSMKSNVSISILVSYPNRLLLKLVYAHLKQEVCASCFEVLCNHGSVDKVSISMHTWHHIHLTHS